MTTVVEEKRVKSTFCHVCELEFMNEDTLVVTPHIHLPYGTHTYTSRGRTYALLYPVCVYCVPHHVAYLEAVASGARFTAVECRATRCACGALTRTTKNYRDYCVPCTIAHKMLDARQREQRLLSKLLVTLRKDLKEITRKNVKELTT